MAKEVESQKVLPRLVADAKIGLPALVNVWRMKLFKIFCKLGIQPSAKALASIENNISTVFCKGIGFKLKYF